MEKTAYINPAYKGRRPHIDVGEYFKLKKYSGFYLLDLCKLEYVRVKSDFGAKEAYLSLLRDITSDSEARAEYSNTDTTWLLRSKGYQIMSTDRHDDFTTILKTMERCRIERLDGKKKKVGVLFLSADEYVFFWPKEVSECGDEQEGHRV